MSKNKVSDTIAILAGLAAGAGMFWILFYTLGQAIDTSISNQDRMLCESAKVSGNQEYLQKCEGYYRDGDILALREGQGCKASDYNQAIKDRNQGDERATFYDKQTVKNILASGKTPVVPKDNLINISEKEGTPCL